MIFLMKSKEVILYIYFKLSIPRKTVNKFAKK